MSLPFLFPKSLLLCKTFSGALIIFGVLGAYFTRPSPTALRQQFATANSTTDSGLLLFPKNLLFHKIFSGALLINGVLSAYFTRPSPPRRSTALRQQFATANSTTDSGLLLFSKYLLLCKTF